MYFCGFVLPLNLVVLHLQSSTCLWPAGKTCNAPVPPLESTALQAVCGTPEDNQPDIERAVETDSLTGIHEDSEKVV